MTSFVIERASRADLGQIDYAQALLDAAQDALPEGCDQEELDAMLAKLIVMDLTAPKTAKTARAHFARYWPLIQRLAPASYDHVIQEYAERLSELR